MSTMTAGRNAQYRTEDIQVLEGLEPVRKRPGMYIGPVDARGLHHLAWEIIDNAVDEYINGFADHITVTLHKSGDALTVVDNGRGIPVEIHPKHKKSGLELVLTVLHAGGKFGDTESGYVHSGGLHGVGASVVNALSKRLVASVRRDGFEWKQEYAKGVPQTKLEKVGPFRGHGTVITFEPDPLIFKTTKFDADTLRARLEDMSFIHSGLHVTFRDEHGGHAYELHNPGGLPAFLKKVVADAGKPTVTEAAFTATRDGEGKMEVALQWTENTEEVYRSYVNGIRTPNGGHHENGLKAAIRKAVNEFIETHAEAKRGAKGLKITADDIREGVTAVLSVFVREPGFDSQTKQRLTSPAEVEAGVDNFVRPALEAWLNNNKTAADAIVGRIILAAKAREASRAAAVEVKRKTPGSRRLSLPGKLADCKTTDRDDAELFIVEGDSAGGSAKQGRNNSTQAVLPLRGKILNGEDLPTAKVLGNQEIADLVTAIGAGAGDKFHYDGLRYGKIILLMDADADGHHITTLMLDFFFRHAPELIRKGHVYIAQPPLYRIDVGKETHWARDDEHKEEILSGLKANAKPDITRFKGLGEMPFRVLAETTLHPRTRTLLKVEIDSNLDAHDAFRELLGKEAEHRYRFIMEKADQAIAEELDV